MFEEGNTFDGYKSLEKKIKQYEDENFVKLSIKNCTIIQYANRKIKKCKFDDKHRYSYIKYVCKHFGEYATQSKGARPNQRYVVIFSITELYKK